MGKQPSSWVVVFVYGRSSIDMVSVLCIKIIIG